MKESLVVDPKESLDERLLSAAIDVFLEKGFAAASVDAIAAKAKASKITFYNHYGNKEALFLAVVNRMNTALVRTLEQPIPAGIPLREALEGFLRGLHVAFLKGDTVKLVRVLHSEADRFPELGRVFNSAGPAGAMRILSEEIGRRMDAGTLQRADPVIAAEQCLHLALGEVTRRILLGVRPPLTKTEVNRRITTGVDVFLRAYEVQSTRSGQLEEDANHASQ